MKKTMITIAGLLAIIMLLAACSQQFPALRISSNNSSSRVYSGQTVTQSNYLGDISKNYSKCVFKNNEIYYENVNYDLTYTQILNEVIKPGGKSGSTYTQVPERIKELDSLFEQNIQPEDGFQAIMKPTGEYIARRMTWKDLSTGEKCYNNLDITTTDKIYVEMEITELFGCGDKLNLNIGDKIYLYTNCYLSSGFYGDTFFYSAESSQMYFTGCEYLGICYNENPYLNEEGDNILYFTPSEGCIFNICTLQEYLRQLNKTSELYNDSWKDVEICYYKTNVTDGQVNSYIDYREKAFKKYLPELGEEYYTCSEYEKEQAEKQAWLEEMEAEEQRQKERVEYFKQKEAGN